MNDTEIISNMISFIEEKERAAQAANIYSESQIKTDVVKAVLDELEREIKNENQQG